METLLDQVLAGGPDAPPGHGGADGMTGPLATLGARERDARAAGPRPDARGAAAGARHHHRPPDPRPGARRVPRPRPGRRHRARPGPPYEPGDDVRRIDWNVTARTSIPHVRVHVPERSLTTWLVLDVSPSMTFGTADRRKADVAEGVALAIGHLSTQRGNRLGVLTFGGPDDRRHPPRGGRAGLLAAPRGAGSGTRRPSAPREVASPGGRAAVRRRRRARAAGSSCSSPTSAARATGTRCWPASRRATRSSPSRSAIRARTTLPDVGELTLVDAETGREVRVDTSSRRLRDRFAEAAAAERAVARHRAPAGRRRAHRAVDPGQLAPLAGGPAAGQGSRRMTFEQPAPPREPAGPPGGARACTSSSSAAARGTRSGSPTWTCSRTSSRRPPAGGATCRRCSTSPRSPRSASRSPGRR